MDNLALIIGLIVLSLLVIGFVWAVWPYLIALLADGPGPIVLGLAESVGEKDVSGGTGSNEADRTVASFYVSGLTRAATAITLHSCRDAWAERAKTCGYPERFAQEALGHNSNAVHRAYAERALKIPSLG